MWERARFKKDLESLADKLGIGENIRFIPAVSDTSEPLSAMDVFVMPSLQEGLGLSIMEAMLSGVPVIASDVGGIPSLVKDGLTGTLVKPKDHEGLALAIIDLLKDKERAGPMALAIGSQPWPEAYGLCRERIDHQGIFSGKDG